MSTDTLAKKNTASNSKPSATLSASEAVALAEYLKTSLELDLQDLGQLSELLIEEKKNLEQSSYDALENITHKKLDITQSLERRSVQRNKQLNSQGLGSEDSKSWLETIEQVEASSGLRLWSVWRSVEKELKSCDRLLKVNEKIAAAIHHSANRFLGLIKEETNKLDIGYNATGSSETSNTSSSRPLARA